MIIAVLIIVIGIVAGFFIAGRRKKIGSTDGTGVLPFMERGGNESATIAVRGVGGLGSRPAIDWGDNENFTMTVRGVDDFGGASENGTIGGRDVGDISPDAARSAREAASDPGKANQFAGKFPGPPTKPPSPNTPGGGTS